MRNECLFSTPGEEHGCEVKKRERAFLRGGVKAEKGGSPLQLNGPPLCQAWKEVPKRQTKLALEKKREEVEKVSQPTPKVAFVNSNKKKFFLHSD